jgi:hypothetical protein
MGATASRPKVDNYADSSASMRKRYPPPTKIAHETYLFFVTPLTYEPWANEGRDDDGLLGFVISDLGFKFVNCRDISEEFVHYPMSCIESWATTGKIFGSSIKTRITTTRSSSCSSQRRGPRRSWKPSEIWWNTP